MQQRVNSPEPAESVGGEDSSVWWELSCLPLYVRKMAGFHANRSGGLSEVISNY